ncbi:hypothetical protein [Hwangdonia lutea]|uniref:Uncharacterized protein n=1 Tax=Hwangdonia lutea TaxID=3075823 RepID=A0AA97EMN5_9FLAO|nr:hypothetical protein [Hwangdonia sp. SCSIO 19198]WOD43249.1 hypothetical protein RNZ46_14760 [Hwangdonia sp. SCSIO 19198]
MHSNNKNNNSSFVVSLLVIVFFIHSLNALSQVRTVYADETGKIISKAVYQKKLKSSIYSGFLYRTDSIVLEKLRLKYYFGRLTPTVKTQFFKFINHRHQIDTTKSLLIRYVDTLRAKSEYPIRNIFIFNNHEIKDYSVTYTEYISRKKSSEVYYRRYKKKLVKLDFYGHNNGHPEVYENLRWYKDYGYLIKKIFCQLKNDLTTIIIHPDGEFYIESTETNLPFTDLFRKRNWFKHKNKFIKDIEKLNIL